MTSHRPRLLGLFPFLTLVLLLLACPPRARAQPTLAIEFTAFGAAMEDNPSDPDNPLTVLFVGQPAVFEVTITNLSEEEQTVFAGGGGSGGYTLEQVTVVPEEAGSCTLNQEHGFVDCPTLAIPGANGEDAESAVKLAIEVEPTTEGTGGFVASAGNADGETHSTGGPLEIRPLTQTQTHTLTVVSAPPDVDITVTPPGDTEKTTFTHEYAHNTIVLVEADSFLVQEFNVLREFLRWEDAGFPIMDLGRSPRISLLMDRDRILRAQYLTHANFHFIRPGIRFKKQGGVDIYANGILLIDNLSEGSVTPFVEGPSGATIDVTDENAPDNSDPLMSFPFEAEGLTATFILTDDNPFINHNARTEAADPAQTDLTFFLPIPAETLDGIRIIHRTDTDEVELFGSDNPLGENNFTSYASIPPGEGVIEVVDRNDGTQLEAFQANFAAGTALLGVLTESSGGGKRQSFSLLLFDAEGNNLEPAVVTANEPDAAVPATFQLYNNYPNPFNPTTTLRFDLPEAAVVRLEVFNTLGQAVTLLIDTPLPPGTHEAVFDARRLPSGVYFYRLTAGSFRATRAMMLLK